VSDELVIMGRGQVGMGSCDNLEPYKCSECHQIFAPPVFMALAHISRPIRNFCQQCTYEIVRKEKSSEL